VSELELDPEKVIESANDILQKFVERTNTILKSYGNRQHAVVAVFLAASKLRTIMLKKVEEEGKTAHKLALWIERTGVADDMPDPDVKN